MKRKFGLSEIKIFMLVAFLWGLFWMFWIPPWQTPDEPYHLGRLGDGIGNPELGEILYQDLADMGALTGNYFLRVNVGELRADMVRPPGYPLVDVLPKGINLMFLNYAPATIGVVLGTLFRFPTFWVLKLGELASLLFYVGISALALKQIPIRKNLMMFLMLLPMGIHQASGIGSDAILNAVCFFFIAYIFQLKYGKEKIALKNIILVLVLGLLITYMKVPYALLLGLIFLLPLEKMSIHFGPFTIDQKVIRKWRIPVAVLLLILIVLAFYLLRSNRFVEIMLVMARNWRRSGRLILETIRHYRDFYLVSLVGWFGWLEAPVSLTFAWGILGFCILLGLFSHETIPSGGKRLKMKIWERILVWFIAASIFILLIVSMFNYGAVKYYFGNLVAQDAMVDYNIREALFALPFIEGVQGRYFIPFLPLVFLPIPHIKNIKEKPMWAVMGVVILVMAVYTSVVIGRRFWW